jgi:hypothetical protein
MRTMRRGGRFGFVLGLVVLVMRAPAASQSGGVALIADGAFPTSDLSYRDVVGLATGQIVTVRGARVTVLLPPKGSAARALVLDRVYGMSESGFQQFWISRILRSSGGEVPKGVTPAQAVQLVQRIPGAIAFVAADELPGGVRVLAIDGLRPGQDGYRLGS